jgi:uncharacterized protein (DUF58 family)
MNYSWVTVGLLIIYAGLFFYLPAQGYLLYAFFSLLSLWFLDRLSAVKCRKLSVQRLFPVPVYQSEQCTVEIVITNPSRFGQRIRWKDEPPFAVTVSGEQGKAFIPAGGAVTLSYSLTAPKRGTFQFGDLNIRTNGFLYLATLQSKIKLPQDLKVYPKLSKLSPDFLERQASQDEGTHRAKWFSMGGELVELREFVTGDDYRKMNWKVTAHIGKPVINEYAPEKDQNVFLFFDNGRLLFDQMDESGSRFDYILDSAMLLSYNVLKHGDLLGALSFNHHVERFLPAGKGVKQLQLFIHSFFDLEAVMLESDYRGAFQFWQVHNNKRCLLFIYTDIIDGESSRELISHLTVISRHHLVVCVTLKKQLLNRLLDLPITSETTAYQKGIALEFLAQRENQKRILMNHGIHVLEVEPGNIAKAVAEHYLYLKKTGRF